MAIIDPDGLFNGDRLRKCSNQARLYWPYFFLMSNGFGRLEINLPKIAERYFSSFNPPVLAQDLEKFILEYHAAHLLFLYEAPDGQLWGQWDTDPTLLKKYKTGKDKKSPSPPEAEFKAWTEEYFQKDKANSDNFKKLLGKLPKLSRISENFPLGVGVGVGEGIGVGIGVGVVSPDSDSILFSIAKTYPTLSHLRDESEIPHAVATALIQAIEKDGKEVVQAGTRNYREATDSWEVGERKYIRDAYKFYSTFEYRKDPQEWAGKPKGSDDAFDKAFRD